MWPALDLSLLLLPSVHVELLGLCVESCSWLLLLVTFSSWFLLVYLFLYFIYDQLRVFALYQGPSEVFQLLTKSSGVVHTVLAL